MKLWGWLGGRRCWESVFSQAHMTILMHNQVEATLDWTPRCRCGVSPFSSTLIQEPPSVLRPTQDGTPQRLEQPGSEMLPELTSSP